VKTADLAVGIDAYHKGWVAVTLGDGGFHSAVAASSLAELLAQVGTAGAVGVDIPIGLPESGARRCDIAARAFVGPFIGPSVFTVPPKVVLQTKPYEEALAKCIQLTGAGLSRQAYGLASKILEAEPVATTWDVVFEVHPEVSFRAMAGQALNVRKTSWAGMWDRLELLAHEGIQIPHDLGTVGAVPPADVVDATAAAWSASRRAAGVAEAVAEPELSSGERQVSIWY